MPGQPRVPAETLTGHAKGDGGETAQSWQQLRSWSLDLSEALARPHRPFRPHSLPSSLILLVSLARPTHSGFCL